jgi:hypothetical protein
MWSDILLVSPVSCHVLPVESVNVKLPAEPPRHPVTVCCVPVLVWLAWFCSDILPEVEVCCATSQAVASSKMHVNSTTFFICKLLW